MQHRTILRTLASFSCLLLPLLSLAQLRIVTWNISNYAGGRDGDLKAAIYGSFAGRSMSPDIIMVQEFVDDAATTAFIGILNTAPGSPGDWAAAPFISGLDTNSEFFYRTGKVDFLNVTVVALGGAPPLQPRNIQRYDFRPIGYSGPASTIACYDTHMKAQDTGTLDDQRRLYEATIIRQDAQSLPAGWNFLVGGDTNIQTSTEACYQELVASQTNNAGRFFDPINSPGSWNNNMNFQFIHTQDPSGSGGMDDRFDQILLSASLIDGRGFDYIGNPNTTYSTTTWNDANHSYRCWGNDGTSFNTTLRITGNTMVGPTIAQALVNVATPAGGHLPVFLDLKVPPKVDATGVLAFGQVVLNSTAQEVLSVRNSGDIASWTANGISALHYSLAASSGFIAPGGNFTANPGAAANNHTITMNTSSAGLKNGTITINSDDPDTPALIIHYTGEVVQEIRPDSFSLLRGIVLSGGLNDLFMSDDSRLVMRPGVVLSSSEAPIQLVLNGTSPISPPGSLGFKIESSANQVNLNQTVSLYNYNTGAFEDVDTRPVGTTDNIATVTISSNPARFVGSGGAMQVKASYKAGGPILAYPWQIRVDQAIWTDRP